MNPSTVRGYLPHLPQPASLPSPYTTTLTQAQPTVFASVLDTTQEWLPELVESEEAPNMLTALRQWIPEIPVPLAVGGSVAVLAAVAGAAWVHDRKKARTIVSLQKELAEQVARGDASAKRTKKDETTINALLVVAQRAAEVDSKLRDDHSFELDGVQKRLGALAADNAGYSKKLKQGGNANAALLVMAQRAAEVDKKLRGDHSAQLDSVQKRLCTLSADNAGLRRKLKQSGNANTALLVLVQRAAEAEEERRVKEDIDSLFTDEEDVDSLRTAKAKVQSLEDSLKNLQSCSAAAEQALKAELQGLKTKVDSVKLDSMSKERSADKLAEELYTRISDRDEANRLLTSDVKALRSQVASLEQDKAGSKAALKRAVDGERVAVFDQVSLKTQVQRLTADNQSLTSQVASLTKKVAAAGTAQSTDKSSTDKPSTDGTAKPDDIPTADGDKRSASLQGPTAGSTGKEGAAADPTDIPTADGGSRSANDKGPAAEPAGKQGGAPANKDEDSASVRKQAASKHNDSTRAHQLELRITNLAAEYRGPLDIASLDYTELAEMCRGFRADQLDLVVDKAMAMAKEGAIRKVPIAKAVGDETRVFTPKVDQDFMTWAIREVKRESEEGTSTPKEQKPINKERRLALLQHYKASSVARASNIDWQLLAKMSNGFDGPLIEKAINEAATMMKAYSNTELSQENIARAIDKVQGESSRSTQPAANLRSRGPGSGFNASASRGNHASGSNQNPSASRGNHAGGSNYTPSAPRGHNINDNNSPSQRGGRSTGGRGGGNGPPKPKVPDFILQARAEAEKKKQQESLI